MRVSARRYKTNPEIHIFKADESIYRFRRYGSNNLYHWFVGNWYMRVGDLELYRYTRRYAAQYACGKVYGPYTTTYQAYDMHDLSLFCPKCLALYHKARFKNGE